MTTWLTQIVEHPLGQRVGWALIHSLWQGAAMALVLAVALRLLRNSSPLARWLASCWALACVGTAPIVTACVVSTEPMRMVATDGSALTPAAPNETGLEMPRESAPKKESSRDLVAAMEGANQRIEPSADAGTVEAASVETVAWRRRVHATLTSALPWIVLAWLAGVTAMSVWHLGGWLLLEWTKRRLARRPAAEVVELFQRLCERLRFSRPVRLLESAAVATPMVVGALWPVILLPLGILGGLTPSQLEAVLAHELAHIRRHDYLIGLLQATLETLMFYHPAVWWISARVRQEAEGCCDAWTLAACPDRKDYAAALVRAAEWAGDKRSFAVAATGGNLATRIRCILGLPPLETRRRRWPAALLIVWAILVVCCALPDETERAIAEQAVAAKFDHFFYVRHNVTNGLAKTDSLVLVKAKADGFEERVVYTKKNLHLDWRPLLVSGGKLYAIHINELLRIDIASGTVEKLDSQVGYYWRSDEKLYAEIMDKELRIYNLANGAYLGVAVPEALQNGRQRTLKVSPEGRRVAFFKVNMDEKREPGNLHGYKLQLVDLATGQTEEMGPEIHTVIYSVESPNIEGKPPPFAWLDEKTILTFSEAPGPVIGLSPEGKVLRPEIPCKVAVLDLTSGKLTEIASLPRWQQWYSQPSFRYPDANGVPRIVLGELGQFRIDLQGKRVIEDDVLRGEYRYRGGRPPEQIAIGKMVLAEGPRFDGVSVAPDGGAAIWQTEIQNKNVLWYHNARDGKIREVARGSFPRAYYLSFIWACAEDLTPAPAAKIPNGWKAIPKTPEPEARRMPAGDQNSGNLSPQFLASVRAASGTTTGTSSTTTGTFNSTTGTSVTTGAFSLGWPQPTPPRSSENAHRQLPAELTGTYNKLDFETRELLLRSFPPLEAVLPFEKLFQDDPEGDRIKVLEALAEMIRRETDANRALPLLISATRHGNVEIRRGAVARLVKFRDLKIKEAMDAALSDGDAAVAALAARYVAAYENLELIDWLAAAMSQPTRSRYFAAKVILADLERAAKDKKGKLPDIDWPIAGAANVVGQPGQPRIFLIEGDGNKMKEKSPDVGWPNADAAAFELYRQTLRNWLAWALQHPRESAHFFDDDRASWKTK